MPTVLYSFKYFIVLLQRVYLKILCWSIIIQVIFVVDVVASFFFLLFLVLTFYEQTPAKDKIVHYKSGKKSERM